MKFQKYLILALSTVVFLSTFSAQAEDTSSAYEKAKEYNRGHVGIDQRREALRRHIANSDDMTGVSSMADIAPAAGDTEDNTQDDININAQAEPQK